MPIALSDVLSAARSRHRAFHPTRVPNKVVGDFLSDYQNTLLQKCFLRDRQFMSQKCIVMLNFGAALPGAAGAGSGKGQVGIPTPGGGFETGGLVAGNLIDAITDPNQGAQQLVDETVATTPFNATTIKNATAAWTVNQFQGLGAVVVITSGTGLGQVREILSNTATVITISSGSDGLGWNPNPDATTMFTVVIPLYGASGDLSAFLQLPAYQQQPGYLVQLDSSGNPFINVTQPLISNFEIGAPLPPAHAILAGTVLYTDGDRDPLTFVSEGMRYDPPKWPAAFTLGGQTGTQLILCGYEGDWLDALQIEIRYAPIAPAFTAPSQLFLLPDAARPCLVDVAAGFMAGRVEGMPGVTINTAPLMQQASVGERDYLASLRLTRSARRLRFREGEI